MTLTELIVSMGIFSILMAVITAAVVSWTGTAVRNTRVADQTTESRRMFTSFDRSVLSASAVNRPVKVGTNWYVEVLDETVTPKVCRQWVFRGGAGELASREWKTGVPSPAPTAWRVLGWNLSPSGGKPFTMHPASVTDGTQSLSVSLVAQRGDGPRTETRGHFSARNSSAASPSQLDLNGDGVSDTQVCSTDFSGWRS